MAATKIEITINDKKIEVLEGSFLLDAVTKAGSNIPTLCNHKDLTPTGTCRLCVCEVEVRGKIKMVTACNYPVKAGLVVWTHSEKVNKHRKMLAEMYLGRWPNVPVIQDIAKWVGITESRFKSELTDENPKACILCGRCVRACDSFVQERIIDFAGRGIKRHMTMPFGEVDPCCVNCTSCSFVCPTGAIHITDEVNHPLDPKIIQTHGMKVNAEMATLDADQCRMREVGTANIVEVMDAYDLLPVNNYKFGSHKDTHKIDSSVLKDRYFTQGHPDQCWHGCSMACAKAVDGYILKTGPYKGEAVIVDGPEYETSAAGSNMGVFDPDFIVEFNFYCDTYGLDTISVGTTIAFVMECYEAGVIDKTITGGKELNFGAGNEALELMHEMAEGKGFGVDVGQGIRWLKNKWSSELGADSAFLHDIGMESKGLEYSEYVSKESLAQQAGYTLAIKGPQHDEAWLIFMDMVNNQLPSFEDKAEALYYFPLFRTWFGLMGLCKIVWNDVSPADNKEYPPQEAAKIPGHVENYWKYFEGMTGIPLDEQKMLDMSARVFNLHKIMNRFLGHNSREEDIPPYRAMGPVTQEEYLSRQERYDDQLRDLQNLDPSSMSIEEKMEATRKYRYANYDKVQNAAYSRRGWTTDGIPTLDRVKELNIDLPVILDMLKDIQ
jgi:aldehyde:ferredoxin oxidoreductase